MSEASAHVLLSAIALYLGLGAGFAAVFLLRGVDRIDPAAHASSPGFRLVILPGATALWPILLRRWLRGASTPPEQRDAHVRAARRIARGRE